MFFRNGAISEFSLFELVSDYEKRSGLHSEHVDLVDQLSNLVNFLRVSHQVFHFLGQLVRVDSRNEVEGGSFILPLGARTESFKMGISFGQRRIVHVVPPQKPLVSFIQLEVVSFV